MDPNKKASEIMNSYFQMPGCQSVYWAKFAAQICIDEILKANPQDLNFWVDVKEIISEY